jgi:hypothetical protein
MVVTPPRDIVDPLVAPDYRPGDPPGFAPLAFARFAGVHEIRIRRIANGDGDGDAKLSRLQRGREPLHRMPHDRKGKEENHRSKPDSG